MQITDAICGRQVEYVIRDDDGGITLQCTDGRQVSLFVDTNGDIQMRGVGVKIVLPGLSVFGESRI